MSPPDERPVSVAIPIDESGKEEIPEVNATSGISPTEETAPMHVIEL